MRQEPLSLKIKPCGCSASLRRLDLGQLARFLVCMLLLLRSPATGDRRGRGHLNTLHRVRRRRGSAVPAALSHIALPMPPERPRISVLLRSDGETLRISEDHGETIDATRCWAQRPLARGRYAHALWKGLGARGVLPARVCRHLLLADRMHASA